MDHDFSKPGVKVSVTKKSCVFAVLMVFSSLGCIFAEVGLQTQRLLEKGFEKAFSCPDAFRDTRLFEVLGYVASESEAIGRVTPRPERLTVDFVMDDNNGSFKSISVHATAVNYYNLKIDHAVFEFPDVSLDSAALAKERILFLSAKSVKIETNVSDTDILRVFHLYADAQRLSHLKVQFGTSGASIRGRVRRGLFVVEFVLDGWPELEGESRIVFKGRRMTLNGAVLPRNSVSSLLKTINPVFDAGRTWLNLKLHEVSTGKGFVKTSASILPRKAYLGFSN